MIAVCLVALVAPAAMTLASVAPQPGQPVVIVTAPWQNALAVSSAAGGALVAPGRIEAIVSTHSGNPRFIKSLYGEGAWLVLDYQRFSLLCQRITGQTQ